MEKFYSDWQMNVTPRVLLADNSIANRVQIKQLLKNLEIQIMEADSGEETRELVSKYEFGAVLLDVNMPDIGGFETARIIATHPMAQHTPIIFYSGARMNKQEIARGYETGAVDSIHWSDLPVVLPAKLKFYLNYYRQKKDLESTSQTKSEFLSNMSHELRTPLNSILVLAQLLADNSERNLSEKQLKFANTIYSSGTDLLNLINEILDLSKVESGRMEFVIDQMELTGFIRDIERKISYTATQKGLKFNVHIDSEVPPFIMADSVRVHQVLNNLLSNAIKFTATGEVSLNVFEPSEPVRTPRHVLQPGESIAFAVVDTGIGIPEDQKGVVFEAFRQADGSIKRKYGGTGLGLSISRKLAHIMGGELIFKSQVGEGSTFVLYLPQRQIVRAREHKVLMKQNVHPAEERAGMVRQRTGETIPPDISDLLRGKRCLLVEDDIINVYVLLSLFDKVGIETAVASNGVEALAKLPTETVDFILMDMMMPEMDGYEATARIKSNPDTKHLPIIAVTARAMKGDREKCVQASVDGYVTKPILAEALFNEIFACLTRRPYK